MNPVIRNILAVITGVIIGGIVNMLILMVMGVLIPPPEGADFSTAESWAESVHLLGPKHYISPFLAHAMQSLVGAFIAVKIAATRKMNMALIVGILSLIGGIAAAFMIPAPTWFIVADLLVAYIPMAWLGGKLGMPKSA